MHLLQTRSKFWHHEVAKRDCRSQANTAQFIPVAQAAFHGVKAIDQMNGLLIERGTGRSNAQTVIDPVEKLYAVESLNLMNGAGNRRLRHVQMLRSIGYAA